MKNSGARALAAWPTQSGRFYGRKALVGQFTTRAEGSLVKRDRSERINFERSRYIPGNGPEHRLGRKV